MITAASNALFFPQNDASIPTIDNSADPLVDFFSLLLAFFPPGATQSQSMSARASDASSDLLSLLDGNAGQSTEDSSVTSKGDRSSEQDLLLSFFASFLQETHQLSVDAAEGPQLAAQDAPSPPSENSRIALQAALLSALLLSSMPNTQEGYQPPQPVFFLTLASEKAFYSQLLPAIPALEGDLAAPLTTQDKEQQLAGLATALSGKATVAALNIGAVERGVIVRRYATFGGSTDQKPIGISSLALEPLAEGKQSSTSASALGMQGPNVVDMMEAGNAPLSSNIESRKFLFSEATLKDGEPAERTKNTASQSAVDFLVQKTEGNVPATQIEQLIASLSSRGKSRGTAGERILFSSGGEVGAANGPGSNLTTAVQPRPEGTPHAGNLESWRQVVAQVGEGIITNVQQDNREARLQLTPPELGKLDIELVVESGRVRAHIVTESADVRALIQSHLPELKHALQIHRLDLDAVRVDVQTGGGEPNTFFQRSQQEEHARDHSPSLPFSSSAASEPEPVPRLPAPGRHGGRVSVWA